MSSKLSQTLPCPKPVLGFIIGRQGHALRAIEKASGAQLQFDDTNISHDFGVEYVHIRLIGNLPQIDRAKRLIMLRMYNLTQQQERG